MFPSMLVVAAFLSFVALKQALYFFDEVQKYMKKYNSQLFFCVSVEITGRCATTILSKSGEIRFS
jgi:hypothetical protein